MLTASSKAAMAPDTSGTTLEASNSVADPPEPARSGMTAGVARPAETGQQNWNWHAQNTDLVRGHPDFADEYSGPNSLGSNDYIRETVLLDSYAGVRLWRGAEAHIDAFNRHSPAGMATARQGASPHQKIATRRQQAVPCSAILVCDGPVTET